jgi:hypothetical protein
MRTAEIEDFLATLPEHTQSKIKEFKKADLLSRGIALTKHTEVERIRADISQANINLSAAQQAPVEPQYRQAKIDKCNAIQKDIDALKLEMLEVQQIEQHNGWGYQNILNWAESLPILAQFEPHIVDAPEGDPVQLLERTRRARADFLDQRKQIERAPLEFDAAKSRAVREIEALARVGAPDISGLFRASVNKLANGRTVYSQGQMRFPSKYVDGDSKLDVLPFMVWMHKDQLLKSVDELLKAHDRPLEALSIEERPERIAEIDAELTALAYEEESLVVAALAQGQKVERRNDIKAEFVLQVKRVANAVFTPKREPLEIIDYNNPNEAPLNVSVPIAEVDLQKEVEFAANETRAAAKKR